MKQHLINWDKVFPILNKMSLIQVFIGIVALTDNNYTWYSNLETRSSIQWRFQLAESTVKYALAKLTKYDILKTKTRGIYTLNTKYLL